MWSISILFLLTITSSFEIISGGVVGCYYGSWAVYNEGHGKAEVSNIDPNLCTHVFYAFAGLNENSNTIESLDAWNDLPDDGGLANYININNLRQQNPSLKVLLSVGGWSEGSEKYSKMVNDAGYRGKFVNSVETFLQKYKFDGLDVDWEYPTQRGGQWSDRAAFVSLLSELKSRFNQHGWLLTGAFGADTELLDSGYDVQNIAKHIDFFNLMTYDYHGLWDEETSANSPLHGSPSIEETIDAWLNAGAPANKIVLGIPFYGLTYILKNQNQPWMGAPAESYSFAGPWSQSEGQMGYNEICNEFNNNGGWSQDYDSDSQTAFATKGKQFISYDNADSIKAKVSYALSKGFAGAMTWSIDTDDLYNDCGNGAHYLLRALHNAVNGN